MKGRWCSARAVAILCAILATAGGAWSPTCIAGDLDGGLDDTARVIGGFQSSLNKFGKAEDPLWRSYTQEAGAFWNEYERRIGRPMRQWACRELNRDDGATVFYPFSGPDLPAAFQLFPDADRYVLVSMQKAEAPPLLGSFSKEQLEGYLAVLRKAWRFYGVLGFFRTDDLDADAKALARPIGVTGALMGFAVRLGFEIEAVDPIQLDLDANQITLRNRTPERSDTWDSVRFTLRKDNRKVHVDYVRIDLSDASLERVPGPGIWIDRMAENPTILKAASHHPQEPEFSIFRNSVLRKAPVIVQDETGIDYGILIPPPIKALAPSTSFWRDKSSSADNCISLTV